MRVATSDESRISFERGEKLTRDAWKGMGTLRNLPGVPPAGLTVEAVTQLPDGRLLAFCHYRWEPGMAPLQERLANWISETPDEATALRTIAAEMMSEVDAHDARTPSIQDHLDLAYGREPR